MFFHWSVEPQNPKKTDRMPSANAHGPFAHYLERFPTATTVFELS